MKNADFEKIKDEGVRELGVNLDKSGLSWSWAANKLDVTPSTMGRILSGKYRPSLEMALEMKALAETVKKIMAAGV